MQNAGLILIPKRGMHQDYSDQDDQDQKNQAASAYRPPPPVNHEGRHSAHQADKETNLE
jgi:hypothetical protein